MPTSLALLLVSWLVVVPSANSHGLGFHAVDGEPGATPLFPEITGPFEAEVTFIFRDLENRSFQRLFDFCNEGTNSPMIAVGQLADSSQLMLEIITTNGDYYVAETPAGYNIPTNVRTTLRTGVEPDGQLWIEIEGQPRADGAIMDDVTGINAPTNTKQIGKSCIVGDDDLLGAVLDFRISSYGEPTFGVEQQRFQNHPAQIFGPFTLSFWARMDNIATVLGQTLFEFSNGANTNDVAMGNYWDPNEMQFCVWLGQSEVWNCVVWPESIVEGEIALWHVGVKSDGTMWMEKDGALTGYSYIEEPGTNLHPFEWKREIRTQMMLGETNHPTENPLNGFILGLQQDGISMS